MDEPVMIKLIVVDDDVDVVVDSLLCMRCPNMYYNNIVPVFISGPIHAVTTIEQ